MKRLPIVVCLLGGAGAWGAGAAAHGAAAAGATAEQESMVRIPAGPFEMGCDRSGPYEAPDGSSSFCEGAEQGALLYNVPLHRVELDAFWIDRHEVTRGEYDGCVAAGVCESVVLPDRDVEASRLQHYPMEWVNWHRAQDYCTWAGKRLPTEAEWERAAGGNGQRRYPWGNDLPASCDAVNLPRLGDVCPRPTGPVAVHSMHGDVSPEGVVGMMGNVMEWTADWAQSDYYARSPVADPAGPDSSDQRRPSRVVRGGHWAAHPAGAALFRRYRLPPEIAVERVGFRCAADALPAPK